MVIGHDRNASFRMAVPQEFDLFKDDAEIIAGMDNEKQQLVRLEFIRRQIVTA
ncbi:hypothetical protein [Bradyrhizobium sp. Ash2021]|uniref:hypothetical protein n=1 Tax=Bradyrhizobium sp. Ash2021 TaxID=2954771 RepID=UPI0028155B80|nr:hypothetical protein [Bradyrhizobium sp. Ash2021]WMT72940.1 hypothetical protein NL528_33915 [Bradyrhizobium sp. Ash2021]